MATWAEWARVAARNFLPRREDEEFWFDSSQLTDDEVCATRVQLGGCPLVHYMDERLEHFVDVQRVLRREESQKRFRVKSSKRSSKSSTQQLCEHIVDKMRKEAQSASRDERTRSFTSTPWF